MMRDPFREGLASGWKHVDASELAADRTFEADVVIVGSGICHADDPVAAARTLHGLLYR